MTLLRRILLILALGLAAGPAVVPAAEFVGIPDQDFAIHYRPQLDERWCWASCIEMALASRGIVAPQDSLVAGRPVEAAELGALPDDLVRGTNGVFPTIDGGLARVTGRLHAGAPPPSLLYAHLQRGRPAILLYRRADGRGHAVLLSGMEVVQRAGGDLDVAALHVFDPAVGADHPDILAGDPLSCRLIYPAHARDRSVAMAAGAIDGVILVDSTPLGPPAASR